MWVPDENVVQRCLRRWDIYHGIGVLKREKQKVIERRVWIFWFVIVIIKRWNRSTESREAKSNRETYMHLLVCNRYKQAQFFDVCAEIAQLGERQTEDLQVPGSIPGFGFFLPGSEREPLLISIPGTVKVTCSLFYVPWLDSVSYEGFPFPVCTALFFGSNQASAWWSALAFYPSHLRPGGVWKRDMIVPQNFIITQELFFRRSYTVGP